MNKKNKEDKFCTYCGKRTLTETYFKGFDSITGEPVQMKRVYCPNSKPPKFSLMIDFEYTKHTDYTYFYDN